MGFFDKLVDAWTDWSVDWNKVGEGWKTAGKSAWNGVTDTWAGTWNLVGSPFSKTLSTRAALSKYGEAVGGYGDALGGVGQGLNFPVARQITGTADWLQNELVKRPLATSLLVTGDVYTPEGQYSDMFERDRWRQAYNTTTYVTAGQALMYGVAGASQETAGLFGVDAMDEQDARDILRTQPNLAETASIPSAMIDPRDREKRNQYFENPWLKYSSGTIDAGVSLFVDPTKGIEKAVGFGKARYWSKEMDAAAVAKGKPSQYMNSGSYLKTKDWIKNADSPERVRQTLLNSHYNGGTVSSLLWTAAKDTEKGYTGGKDLYDLTFRSLYGDEDAWFELAQDAERIADTVGSKMANYSIGQVAKNYGLGDEVVDAQIGAWTETKAEAFADAMVNGHGLFGQLGESVRSGGLLTGQTVPQLRTSSKWRVGVHQWAYGAPHFRVGRWARRGTQAFLPSSKSYRQIDFNDFNQASVLRANLEKSNLDPADVDKYVSAYGMAGSPESRFRIFNAAEDAAFAKAAEKHGMTKAQIDAMLPVINRFRQNNRQVLASNRRFMSTDVRKLADKRNASGRPEDASAAGKIADALDDGVKAGDMPPAVYHITDEDGVMNIIPQESDVSSSSPVLISQHADVSPMMDWRVLDSALWWQNTNALGRGIYSTKEGALAAAESVISVWKISAIMRPGYVWRAVSDEIGRVMATMGSGRVLMGTAGGLKNSATNWVSRGRLSGEVVKGVVTRRKASRTQTIDVDADVDDVAMPMPADGVNALGRNDLGEDASYGSYEAAMADGLISVDDFLERVLSHGNSGTLSPRMKEVFDARWKSGTIDDKTYRRHALDAAMTAVGRGTYVDAAWQRSLLDQIINMRVTKAQGTPGDGLVIDPFTGVSPDTSWRKAQQQFSFSRTLNISPQRGLGPDADYFDVDYVYNYISENADELLKPGNLLAGYMQPDGRISLSIARANPDVAMSMAIAPSGGKRIRLPFAAKEGRAYKDSGSATFRIKTSVGDVEIAGAFEGQGGDLFRQQASSRGTNETWADSLTNIEHARMMAKSGRWVDVNPSDWPAYKPAWERAVNLQLANDPVARQIIAGKSVDDVISWMHNTAQGRAYNAKMGPWKSRYAEQVITIEAMVDTYLPWLDELPAESKAMRAAALAGTARVEDLEALMPRDYMPQVHGASLEYATGTGAVIDFARKAVDKTFKVLSDMPSDKFVRHPYAAKRYQFHTDELVRARAAELKSRGESFDPGDLASIEKQARSRSLQDVQKYLYEATAQHDLAKAMRLFVPFGSAIADSTLKWGVVMRENPTVPLQLWKLWNAPEKAGLVQDEDGNQLRIEDGKEVWYGVNPKTGERERVTGGKSRQIVFRVPSFMTPDGVGPQVARIDKNVFRTFLDMPTFGPVVAVPANEFALSHPEFSEQSFVRTFILPFGPSADWGKSAVPGNLRNVYERFLQDENSEEYQSQAAAIYQAEMVNYSLGKRDNAPSFEESRKKAAELRGMRFLWRMSGVSSQFVSPYQPYIDYYHKLRAADPQNADERFYDEMGEEYFSLTASVTRNVMGLPASVGAFNQYNKLTKLMDAYPELAPLIAGAEGAGEFNRAVYESQKQTLTRSGSGDFMRERLSPDEAWADMERRKGWIEYSRFMSAVEADMTRMGVTSLTAKKAAPIKNARDEWIAQHQTVVNPYGGTEASPWFKDYSTFDTGKITNRLTQMREIVQDRRLQGRDDIRGLVDYLSVRDQYKRAMARKGYATLDSKKAESLSLSWQQTVFAMKQSNLAFADLYDRWLTNDASLEAD